MSKKIFKYLIDVILILVTFILQICVLNKLDFFGITPNLILVEVIMVSIMLENKKSVNFSLIMGLISDIIFEMQIGKYLLTYVIISFIVNEFGNKYRKDNKAAIIYVTFISIVIFELINLGIYIFKFGEMVSIIAFLKQTALQGILSIGIAFLVYKIFDETYLQKQKVQVKIARL